MKDALHVVAPTAADVQHVEAVVLALVRGLAKGAVQKVVQEVAKGHVISAAVVDATNPNQWTWQREHSVKPIDNIHSPIDKIVRSLQQQVAFATATHFNPQADTGAVAFHVKVALANARAAVPELANHLIRLK